MLRILISLLLFLGSWCGAQEYLLGPGDLIEIHVLNFEEINGEYRVGAQGTITLPYLEQIEVRNLTTQEIQETIVARLQADFLNDPQVMVKISEYRSRPVSVVGAVKNPGPIENSFEVDLLQALSLAGGVQENAGPRILIMRKASTGVGSTLEIDLDDLLYEGNPILNIPIFPGDTINVPIEQLDSVFITGEVKAPGEYEFSRRDHLTLLQLISKAKGFTDYAKQRRVMVRREREDGGFREFKVNVKAIKSGREADFPIQANDIVIVP